MQHELRYKCKPVLHVVVLARRQTAVCSLEFVGLRVGVIGGLPGSIVLGMMGRRVQALLSFRAHSALLRGTMPRVHS